MQLKTNKTLTLNYASFTNYFLLNFTLKSSINSDYQGHKWSLLLVYLLLFKELIIIFILYPKILVQKLICLDTITVVQFKLFKLFAPNYVVIKYNGLTSMHKSVFRKRNNKKSNKDNFDIAMGSFQGAKVCDLIG